MLAYFFLWFPMLLIAIFNGTLREWYKKWMGEFRARQCSTLLLLLFFTGYIYWAVHRFPLVNGPSALRVGAFWMVLTLGFEFGFGWYRRQPMKKMLAEYNIFKGKLWILVPIWILIAPYLLYKI